MSQCPAIDYLLVLPHLRVQNANAISSPLTHGFPSITAFLGVMWALERRTHQAGLDLQFNAVGVVAHQYQEQSSGDAFTRGFHLTRNPIDKDGSTAAIVEEGRMHLDISLVFGIQSQALLNASEEERQKLAAQVQELLMPMRVAGGSLIPSTAPHRRQQPYVVSLPEDSAEQSRVFREKRVHLLPGFALVERADLLQQRHEQLQAKNPQASALEAWLSLSRINWRYDAEHKEWQHDRAGNGWIVPIPVGYGALTEVLPAGSVANARDKDTPFRFVESLFSIGQWVSPHRLESVQDLLWYADSQPEQGLYRCRNDYQPTPIFNFD